MSEKNDLLYGVLMIDRPKRASELWLMDLEAAYGRVVICQMASNGDRGLLSQIYVRDDSVPYVQEKDDPVLPQLEPAVRELFHITPAVKLDLWWDGHRKLWRSEYHREPVPTLTCIRARYGKRSTPPEQREYYVPGWGTAVGTVKEIAEFVRGRMHIEDFVLDLYDQISSPDRVQRMMFGKLAKVDNE